MRLLWSALLTPLALFAHGAPEYPISRQYNCYQNPQLPACRAAVAGGLEQARYDWNGVNQGAANGNHQAVVPNGTLCAGGKSLFRGFDLARADWTPTLWAPGADGRYEFRYHATAPHSTLYMRFYLTRPGFDPAAHPLTWADLDQVAEVPRAQIVTTTDSRYVVRLALPARSGRHLLYTVWQRADSQEAFYACSDVSFGNSPTPPSEPSLQLGQLSARQDLPAGATLNFRVFGANGQDAETVSYTLNTAMPAAAWLAALANKINQTSAYVRLGLIADATVLQVYRLANAPAVTFTLDTVLPANPPPPSAGNAWVEGSTYAVGQVVTYNGVTYRCLQAHTAWRGAGWYPSAPGVIDVLWKRL